MSQKSTGQSPAQFIFRIFQGALIGLGAVLPGISGGVLGVIFGVYKPIMELISHPFANFKTHVPKLIPVFIGGIIAGFIAGYTIRFLRKTIKLPPSYRTLLSIFIYPLLGTLVAGGAMVFLIGQPIATFMEMMTNGLNSLSGAAKVPLGLLLGSMVGVDMGGPINKVAYTFAQTQVDTLPYLMGGVGIAGAVPPLGIGLATLLFKKKFSPEERDQGIAAIIMGCMGITEGAIPYATADPIRVIPAYVIGSAVGCVSGFLFGCLNHAPWGGLIVLPVVDNRLGYLAGALIGALVVAILMRILKPDYVPMERKEENFDEIEELDFDFEEL